MDVHQRTQLAPFNKDNHLQSKKALEALHERLLEQQSSTHDLRVRGSDFKDQRVSKMPTTPDSRSQSIHRILLRPNWEGRQNAVASDWSSRTLLARLEILAAKRSFQMPALLARHNSRGHHPLQDDKMKTSNITSSILLLALSVPTIAWGVAFYSGQACNEDSEFSDVMYYGVGKKGTTPCMSWGDGAEGVTCYNVK